MTLKLLIVDDDEAERQALRFALEAARVEAEIHEATETTAAIELARANAYDCIILDPELPGEPGVSAVQRLRASRAPRCRSSTKRRARWLLSTLGLGRFAVHCRQSRAVPMS